MGGFDRVPPGLVFQSLVGTLKTTLHHAIYPSLGIVSIPCRYAKNKTVLKVDSKVE